MLFCVLLFWSYPSTLLWLLFYFCLVHVLPRGFFLLGVQKLQKSFTATASKETQIFRFSFLHYAFLHCCFPMATTSRFLYFSCEWDLFLFPLSLSFFLVASLRDEKKLTSRKILYNCSLKIHHSNELRHHGLNPRHASVPNSNV